MDGGYVFYTYPPTPILTPNYKPGGRKKRIIKSTGYEIFVGVMNGPSR